MTFKIVCCFALSLLPWLCLSAQQAGLKPLGKKGKLVWKEEFNGIDLPDTAKYGHWWRLGWCG